MSETTRLVPGHTLVGEGAPHDNRGYRIGHWSLGVSGCGRGRCSCGALSPVMQSANQRKQWHREHKAEVSER